MLAAATFGLAAGGIPGVIAAYLADHLATRAFGVAFGAVTLAFGGGQVAGPQLGGWIAEATGSFTPTFLLSSGIAARARQERCTSTSAIGEGQTNLEVDRSRTCSRKRIDEALETMSAVPP